MCYEYFTTLIYLYIYIYILALLCPLREILVTLPGSGTAAEEQRYPILSVRTVFSCVQSLVWLPAFGMFNVRRAGDSTQGLYGAP